MPIKKIYIAEDQPMHQELMRAAIESQKYYDYSIKFFSNGLELYQTVLEDPPDLLILDIILPNLTGLAISRLLKFHDDYVNIPIIMVSSITESDLHDQVVKVGANIFLPKPLNMKDLINQINQLLQ